VGASVLGEGADAEEGAVKGKNRLKYTIPPSGFGLPPDMEGAMARNLQDQMCLEREQRVLQRILEGMFDSLVPREKNVTAEATYEIEKPKMLEGGKREVEPEADR